MCSIAYMRQNFASKSSGMQMLASTRYRIVYDIFVPYYCTFKRSSKSNSRKSLCCKIVVIYPSRKYLQIDLRKVSLSFFSLSAIFTACHLSREPGTYWAAKVANAPGVGLGGVSDGNFLSS